MYIDRFKFQSAPGFWGAPGAGWWRGRKQKGQSYDDMGSCKITTQGQTFSLPEYYAGTVVQGIVNETGTHGVSVYERDGSLPGVNETVWKQAPNNDLTTLSSATVETTTSTGTVTITNALDYYFQVDYAQGRVTLGSSAGGKIYCRNASNTTGAHYVEIIYSHDFNVQGGVEAWIHEKQKVVKLDLSTINESNCPRDPKYKNSTSIIDRSKYGVIFSEVPLAVWGVPKAPVTIVCTSDLYVGPINAPYNDPNDVDKWWAPKIPNPVLKQDDTEAKPVGLIASGILLYDYTLGVSNNGSLFSNTFGTAAGTGSKSITLNRVAIYHSWIKDPSDPNLSWYKDRFGMIAMGGVTQPRMPFYGALYPATNCPTLIGSVYYCADDSLIAAATAKNILDPYQGSSAVGTVVYANSFRRSPPQHMPMNIFMTNYRILNSYDNAETFLVELERYLATGAGTTYDAQFSEIITNLVNEMESGN